jgi:hypothetical protein
MPSQKSAPDLAAKPVRAGYLSAQTINRINTVNEKNN